MVARTFCIAKDGQCVVKCDEIRHFHATCNHVSGPTADKSDQIASERPKKAEMQRVVGKVSARLNVMTINTLHLHVDRVSNKPEHWNSFYRDLGKTADRTGIPSPPAVPH